MKKDKNIYWTTTIIATALTVIPGLFYFTSEFFITALRHLGFPDYFRIELGIGKIIGGILMLTPVVSKQIKEWVYVAFGITLLSGSLAHFMIDGVGKAIAPLVVFVILCISYRYFRKLYFNDNSKQA